MIRRTSGTRRLVAALVAAFAVVVPAAARAASPAPGTVPLRAPDLLAPHGFGDRQNSYAWAMAWFKGKLYVGTGRSVLCVEDATNQFYFTFTAFYQTQPAPHVHCPKNMYDLDLRAEIWQYTPGPGTWRMVYRAPANIPNPRARGKFLAPDIAYRGMKVVRDPRGREALFVSGVTADEYVPELARSHPPRLLRTFDGERFHDISVRTVVHRSGGFPDRRPIGYRGLELWGNRLYVLASTALTGDGAVFRVDHPFARKARFKQVTPTDMHVFEMQRFNNHLYVGTGSFDTGYGVYKTRQSTGPYHWTPVVTNGAGMGTQMVSVVSMYPFKGRLYVGGVSWASTKRNGLPAAELIRIDRNDRWEVVTGDPRMGPDGQMRSPISGLPAGFGNSFNSHLWRMVESDGTLYVGTLDWTWLLQDNEQWAGQWSPVLNTLLSGEVGFDLWASCDGVSWYPVTRTAFNNNTYDFGVRTLIAGPQGFYIGSANHAYGTAIWHDSQSACRAVGRVSRARAAQAPQGLLTDVQRDGTVVSWEPSANVVRYRIERAEYVEVPLSVRPSAAGPGVLDGGGQPELAPVGAPGSEEVRLPVRGAFAVVGETTRPYFVDRTRDPGKRYEYQVVAEGPNGAPSAPSNVQIVPDPRPPATVAQLDNADPRATAAAALARNGSRSHRSLTGLERLARTAGDDQVRQLAYRLERRLRYLHVAGGTVTGP